MSSADQWCVRILNVDCNPLMLPVPIVVPMSPAVGTEVEVQSAASGGWPCPIEYRWRITAPDGSTGWPGFVPTDVDRQGAIHRFVPLLGGMYEAFLDIVVEGQRTQALARIPVTAASCAITLSLSHDGTNLIATPSDGTPPYRYAWSAEAEYCEGVGRYATGFADSNTRAYAPSSGFGIEHRVVAIDAAGCVGTATLIR
jgi:hypothetical protein